MKKTNTTIDKMIKNFDKELRNLLLTDLKVARVANKVLIKNIGTLNNDQLLIA